MARILAQRYTSPHNCLDREMNGNLLSAQAIDVLQSFSISIGIGLLMGLERERMPDSPAGLRTFALIALFGSVCGMLAQSLAAPWITVIGIVIVGAVMIAAYVKGEEPGATTTIAAVLCCAYGALVWLGHKSAAGMLGVVTTALLYFKAELRDISERITRKDIVSILQFGALTLIILPILPNTDLGPFKAINPYQTWWMVILISGLSLAGYVALRLFGQSHGAPILGVMGGLASSTATTMVFSRRVAVSQPLARLAVVVILMANIVVLVRLAFYAIALQPQLLPHLLAPLVAGFLLGMSAVSFAWKSLGHAASSDSSDNPSIEVKNPAEIKTALLFGGLYAFILVLTAGLEEIAGTAGLLVIAFVSGLTDVDAITLSSIRLFGIGKIEAAAAAQAILVAALANLTFKLGLVWFIAGRRLFWPVLAGFALIAAGIGLGLMLGPVAF
jgi:uncharacterized membrane protein (DUF4010 family)